MPRCSSPATNPPSSTGTIWWSTAPSPAAATGPRSSKAMSPCARRSIRGRGEPSSVGPHEAGGRVGGMNARLERKLRLLAAIIVVGTLAGVAVNLGQGRPLVVGAVFGFITSVVIGGVELFVLDGPMRDWLGGLSFTANLMVRSAIYAAFILIIQLSQSDGITAGLSLKTSSENFWSGVI